jgi:hypothetical protein
VIGMGFDELVRHSEMSELGMGTMIMALGTPQN